MPVRDFCDIAAGEEIVGDVCIVGSGPAGVTLARELGGGGLRVILLESGGLAEQAETDALSEIENVGAPRTLDQSVVRPRVVGGASSIWTGRCASFDEIDFAPRPWVPHSGWPISLQELSPFLDRSASHLGLGVGSGFTETGPRPPGNPAPVEPAIDRRILRPFFWQFSRDGSNFANSMRFGPRILAEKTKNVHLITNATVVHINTDTTASAARSVEFAGLNGERGTVVAPMIVLCAGGIENARLLLASNRVAAKGLGNGNDLVGRFLMDHPRGGVATFDHARASELSPHMRMQLARVGGRMRLFCKGLQLSPEVQEQEGLLNCAVWLSEIVMDDDPWTAVKRIISGSGKLGRDFRAITSNFGLFTKGLREGIIKGDVIPRKLAGLELNCTVEQRPDAESRVTLSERVDRNGTPLSRVHWRINEQEQHTVRRAAELVAREFARLHVQPPILMDWVRDGEPLSQNFRDVAHHIGTTRMSVHPREGVVDSDCQVHNVRGLYVAGSSVFPTGSHVNPTQMIVALAIRLADTLKKRLAPALPPRRIPQASSQGGRLQTASPS